MADRLVTDPARSHHRVVTIALVAASLVGAGCSSSDQAAPPPTPFSSAGPARVAVTLTDFHIEAGTAAVAGGDVTFNIVNKGVETHEFLVVKSDRDPTKLPTDEAGDVSEDGAGLMFIDEREGIKVATTAALRVTLEPGNYVLLCNLPSHYQKGMATRFTVGPETGATASTPASSASSDSGSASGVSPEEVVVPAAEVAAGLADTNDELAALGRDLGADPAAAVVAVYDRWYGYEGTVRSIDMSTYLDLEDQLSKAKRAADSNDAVAMGEAATEFARLADGYLAAHPG